MAEESTILGVGTDITDVARIARMINKHGDSFIQRTFTDAEIEYCSKCATPSLHYAARFAAKEAMVKALGTGFIGDITLKSVSIEHNEKGAPIAVLDDYAKKALQNMGGAKMLVSISHLKEYAQGFAIISK